MKTKISKWGNSFAIRIPASMAKSLQLKENSTVYLSNTNFNLTVSKEDRDKKFKQMMAQVKTKQKLVNFGEPVGKERFWEDE